MFRGTRERFDRPSGKIRPAMAAAICAAGLGIGVGGTVAFAGLLGPNPTPQTETPKCPYVTVAGCNATPPCFGSPLVDTVKSVNYDGGALPSSMGCGDMVVILPNGDTTEVPCGPSGADNCSQ